MEQFEFLITFILLFFCMFSQLFRSHLFRVSLRKNRFDNFPHILGMPPSQQSGSEFMGFRSTFRKTDEEEEEAHVRFHFRHARSKGQTELRFKKAKKACTTFIAPPQNILPCANTVLHIQYIDIKQGIFGQQKDQRKTSLGTFQSSLNSHPTSVF